MADGGEESEELLESTRSEGNCPHKTNEVDRGPNAVASAPAGWTKKKKDLISNLRNEDVQRVRTSSCSGQIQPTPTRVKRNRTTSCSADVETGSRSAKGATKFDMLFESTNGPVWRSYSAPLMRMDSYGVTELKLEGTDENGEPVKKPSSLFSQFSQGNGSFLKLIQ